MISKKERSIRMINLDLTAISHQIKKESSPIKDGQEWGKCDCGAPSRTLTCTDCLLHKKQSLEESRSVLISPNVKSQSYVKTGVVTWEAPRRSSTKSDPRHTLEADQWKIDLIKNYGHLKTTFGIESTNMPGLILTLYPGRQSSDQVIIGLPRILIRHHSYRQAVNKMHLMVVGFIARLRAGEDLSSVKD